MKPDDPGAVLAAIRGADPETMSRDQLAVHVSHLQRLRSWIDAEEVRAVRRTRHLEAVGSSESAESMAADAGRHSSKQSRTIAERSAVCDDLPHIEAALTTGHLAAGHVDAIAVATRHLGAPELAEFHGMQAALVAEASQSSVDSFARSAKDLARSITARHRSGSDHDELDAQRATSNVKRWVDGQTGMHHTHLELDPVRDAKLHSAVNAELARLRAADGNSGTAWQQMLVEAWVGSINGRAASGSIPSRDVAGTSALTSTIGGPPARSVPVDRVPEITVVVSWARLIGDAMAAGICETDNGSPLPVATVRRMCCDAEVLPVVLGGDGEVLDAGRSIRTASRGQRRALRAVHRGCAHPDCTVGFDACRIHHVKWWWEHLGPTDIDNLLPLCERHHHLVHEGGWTLSMDADRHGRWATWVRPDGSVFHEGPTADRTESTAWAGSAERRLEPQV